LKALKGNDTFKIDSICNFEATQVAGLLSLYWVGMRVRAMSESCQRENKS